MESVSNVNYVELIDGHLRVEHSLKGFIAINKENYSIKFYSKLIYLHSRIIRVPI